MSNIKETTEHLAITIVDKIFACRKFMPTPSAWFDDSYGYMFIDEDEFSSLVDEHDQSEIANYLGLDYTSLDRDWYKSSPLWVEEEDPMVAFEEDQHQTYFEFDADHDQVLKIIQSNWSHEQTIRRMIIDSVLRFAAAMINKTWKWES